MSDFVIFENPAVKAARLERENLHLRSENLQLRQALAAERGEVIPIQAISATKIAGTTGDHPMLDTMQVGSNKVQIGRLPGRSAPRAAIPSLQQTQPAAAQQSAGQPSNVQIFAPGQTVPALANRIMPPGAPQPQPTPTQHVQQDDSEQRFALIELGTPNQKQG